MAFTADSVSILNGQDVVDVNSAESIENIKSGDFLQIGSFPLVEIKQAYKNGQGQKFIQLTKAWELTTQSNQPAIVIPTSGEFRAAVKALQDANILINDNQQALQDYQNNLGTVTFKKSDGTTTTVKTLKQIEADNLAQMNAYHPHPWAMRKGEFEAMRAANKEKYTSGFYHKGKEYTNGVNRLVVASGLWTNTTFPNILNLGRDSADTSQQGDSKQSEPVICIDGVLTELWGLSTSNGGNNLVKLPSAEDGTRTYDSATGEPISHTTPALAFASETDTNKVVTDRVDMWGFEGFLREINDNDPFVYKNGLIQSLANNINGVATVNDNIRPDTYFAWYKGDATSRGKGVNWQIATEAERTVIASDRRNNIYFDDSTGKFYQWCVHGRSFAGIGNGDWGIVDSGKDSQGGSLRFDGNSGSCVSPQGIRDDVENNRENDRYHDKYFLESQGNLNKADAGVFTATLGAGPYSAPVTSVAVGGQCYFLVCGTIPRLNQGSYHPKLNHLGTKGWRKGGGDSSSYPYHQTDSSNWINGFTTLSCFANLPSESQESGGGSFGGALANNATNMRPDSRKYDAIYEDGQGGVCRDMRYSAHKLTAEDFAKEDLKIKSGEYRGREKLFFTKKVLKEVSTSDNAVATGTQVSNIDNYTVGDLITVYSESGETLINEALILSKTETGIIWDGTKQFERVNGETYILVTGYYTNISVAGEFTHTEVLADPDQIDLCADLKDGWYGRYNPLIPNNQTTKVSWEWPVLETPSSGAVLYTQNSGASWGVGSSSIWLPVNSENKSATVELTAGIIVIASYKTKAKMTQPAPIAEIHGSISDINYLFTSMDSGDKKGRLLNFSLTGLIQTHAAAATKIGLEHIRLESLPILPNLGKFWGLNVSAGELRHAPLSLDAPSNNGPAFKALNYNVAKNQQGFVNYAYAELTYDATAGDWGDDGKIHPADNQTTMLDENGHTNLVGTACCVEPLGWV